MNEIIDFYGKYNEEKRLLNPWGRVEYLTTMHYIEKYIAGRTGLSIIDIGSATGRYAVPLALSGHKVTAVDLVPYHIGILRQKIRREKIPNLSAFVMDARALRKIPDDSMDLALLLGPMYHLFTEEEKIRVLSEAKRVVKPGGLVIAGYILNEYAVLTFGVREGNLLRSMEDGHLSPDFHVNNTAEDLFNYDRLSDIGRYRKKCGLKRVNIFAQDGPANYMRERIKEMTPEFFEAFMRYHLSTCERKDLLGAGCHVADVLIKPETP